MALNSWQRLDRVLPGLPFGSGADGSIDISADTTQTLVAQTLAASATSTSATLGSAGSFSNGDVVMCHQSRGTGAGQWEINRIVSGAGTTSITLQVALVYTYTTSGNSQAQMIKVPQYTTVVVDSGKSWTGPDWNLTTGGFLIFSANVSATITGNAVCKGKVGATGNLNPGELAATVGGGFQGGKGKVASATVVGWSGEGSTGPSAQTTSNVGNGAGAGQLTQNATRITGSGGGNGTAGQLGSANGGGTTVGTVGATSGAADLSSMVFGGGASGHIQTPGADTASGGSGGGIVAMFVKNLTVTGTVDTTGGNGGALNQGVGGSGAGGSILVQCFSAVLGTSLVKAPGGSVFGSGDGGTGIISVFHSGTVTGTSNPTFNDTSDATLIEKLGGAFFFNII